MTELGNNAHLLPLAVDTLVFTFRMLALVLSAIALTDWVRSRRHDEFPPYDRKRNERAWNWAAFGFALGGLSFIALDMNYRVVTGQTVSDLFVAAVWFCFANAITERMAARVAEPVRIYQGASIFLIGGFLYAFLAGA